MRRHYFGFAVLSLMVLNSCGNDTGQQKDRTNAIAGNTTDTISQTGLSEPGTNSLNAAGVPYTPVTHHFVKNTYKQGALENPKIESEKQFEAIFGAAATMNDQPTQVDFTKQYVIAVIGKETDTPTVMQAVSLQKQNNGDIVLTYEMKREGGKQSYTIMPFLAIAVDRSNTGKVILQQKQTR